MRVSNTKFRKKLKRYNQPGHARELTFSCYRKYPFFNDPIACAIFLDLLCIEKIKYRFELWSYVIMPDHVHLLIWPEANGHLVPYILHTVKGKTGRQYKNHLKSNTPEIFNAFCIQYQNKRKFRFWQPGGGYDRNLWNPKPVHYAIKYIEHNPVRAGLVSRSDKYRWSSAWARRNKCGLIPDEFNISIVMES